MASKRSRSRVPNRYGPTVAPAHRASEVAVFRVDPELAARKDLSATDLRGHATLEAIDTPYRQYARNDPRRSRSGFDRETYGNWNTERTPNPATTPADPSHPSADD